MNILLCMPTLANGKGGSERVAVELGLAMGKRGHNIAWAYKLKNAQSGALPSYAMPMDAIRFPYEDTLLGMQSLRSRAKGFAPDIILGFYANWQLFEILDLFHDFNIPLCFQECSNPERVLNQNWAKASNSFLMRSQILQFASGIRVTRNEYKKSFPTEILDCVEAFPNAFSRLDNIPGISASKKTILHVGASKTNKNADAMLDAFGLLAPLFPDWKLALCTTASSNSRPEYAKIKNRIAHEFPPHRIVLVENMEDMESLYADTAIHCITSMSEGLPNCVCEAMCRGIPSVGFAASTGTNLLIRHNVDGLLVGNTPEELAFALQSLMENESLRQRLGQNAWEAAEQFEPEKVYNWWEKFLLSSIDRGKTLVKPVNTISGMVTDWSSLTEKTWRGHLENRISNLHGDIIFFGCGNLYVNFRKLFDHLNPVAILVDGEPSTSMLDGIPVTTPDKMDERLRALPIAIFSKDAKVIEHRLREQYGAQGQIICVDRRMLRNSFEPGLPHPLKAGEIEAREKLVAAGLKTYKTYEQPLHAKINREEPACAFCGSKDTVPWLSSNVIPWYGDERFNLVRCQKCNLIYASPRPTEQWVTNEVCHLGEMFYNRKLARPNVQEIHNKLAKELLLMRPYARSVFDIAFGAGTLLHAFRNLGLEASGNEINAFACGQLAAQGYDVINKPTRMLDLQNSFDIVTMLDYVEHTYTPFDDLLKAREMLRKNGLLYLKTLYLGCPAHLRKGECWQLFGRGHFYYYLPDVIMGMVENAGFNIISVHKGGLIHIAAQKK